MIQKIDHVAIATKNIEEKIKLYQEILGLTCTNTETVASQQIKIAMFKINDISLELMEPLNEQSPISKFIEKNGEKIHHIAFEVDDIEKTFNTLKEKNINLIGDAITKGADHKKIIFIHPKSTGGVLIELCQKTKDTKKITVVPYAHLTRYAQDKQEITIDVDTSFSIADILNILKIPANEVAGCIINQKNFPLSHSPIDNDRIELLPALAGG